MFKIKIGLLLLAVITILPISLSGQSATLSEDITDEAHIRSGGGIITVDIDCLNDTLNLFNNTIAQDIINGMSGGATWDLVKSELLLNLGNVTRQNDSIFQILLPAVSNYFIGSNDQITVDVPASAVYGGSSYTATPDVDVTNLNTSISFSGTILSGTSESHIRAGGRTLSITADYNEWATSINASDIESMFSGSTALGGFPNLGSGDFNVNDNVLTINFPQDAGYYIGSTDNIAVSVTQDMFSAIETLNNSSTSFSISNENPVITLETVSISEGDMRSYDQSFSIYLSGDEFIPSINVSNLLNDFTAAPANEGWDTYLQNEISVNRVSPQEIEVVIDKDGGFRISTLETVTLSLSASHLTHTSTGSFDASGSVTFTAMDPYLVLYSALPQLTESNLNGALIRVGLKEDVFENSTLLSENFTLTTGVPNLSIGPVVYYFGADTCGITLVYDGTDFDNNPTISLTVDNAELNGDIDAESENSLPVDGLFEPNVIDVSIPEQDYGIGETVYCTIEVESSSQSGFTYNSGTIAGKTLSGMTEISDDTYRVQFEVEDGDQSYDYTDNIPVVNLRLYNPSDLVYGSYFNFNISQPGDLIDADRPEIISALVNGGSYNVGQTLTVVVTADEPGYTFNPALTTVNGIAMNDAAGNVSAGIVSGNQYYIDYTVAEGNTDLTSGSLPVEVVMRDGVDNENLTAFNLVSGVNPIIDAHTPQLLSASIVDPGVTIIGETIEILLNFSEGNITALPGTQVNGVPLGSRVNFQHVSGAQYRLTYTVYENDQNVDAGNLTYNIEFKDAYGNESSSSLNPSNNTVSIFATRPTGSITGSGEICRDDSLMIFATFTGFGPWDLTITSDLGYSRSFTDVTNPLTFYVKPTSTDNFTISSLNDLHGNPGVVTGQSVVIIVNLPDPANILNSQLIYLRDRIDPVILQGAPPGGIFSGMGVESSTDLFYPNLVDTSGVTTIYYNYVNEYGCASLATKQFAVIDEGYELDNMPVGPVCATDPPFILTAVNVSGNPGSFRLFDSDTADVSSTGLSDPSPDDDAVEVLPSQLEEGSYWLEYSFTYNSVTYYPRSPFYLNKIVSFNYLSPDTICRNASTMELFATPNSDYTEISSHDYVGQSVDGNISSGFFFNPANALVGENNITYTVTSTYGCSRDTVISIRMLDVPDVQFDVSSICIPLEGGNIALINNSDRTELVKEWYWQFGDVNSGSNDTSTLISPIHDYTAPGNRTIKLRVETLEGCVENKQRTIEFADKPVADFRWKSDCYNPASGVEFINESSSENLLVNNIWSILDKNKNIIDSVSNKDLLYQFDHQDDYFIRLICTNDKTCTDTLERLLVLKPTLQLLPNVSYFEAFDDSNGRWDKRAADSDGISSWSYGQPDFANFIPNSGDYAWYTDLPELPEEKGDESSWVQSPCFDLSDLERPLIRLDIMKSFDGKRDGAVIQYSTSDGDVWNTIGDIDDGVEWYNGFNIINQPGGSGIGWSGSTIFDPDTAWITSAHDLNVLIDSTNVIFRIAYATDGGSVEANQGFAFDNLFIGERTRKTVLEHFTNSSSTVAFDADNVVDNFITGPDSLDVITLQYHTAYPGTDPMNQNNPHPASSRTFYYGITEVPFAVLDGGFTEDKQYDFVAASPQSVDARLISLEMPYFNMSAEAEIVGNAMDISVIISAQADYQDREILWHTVIAERSVNYNGANGDTEFKNVVLEMLPDPAGKLVAKDWTIGESMTESFTWTLENYQDVENLMVVSFLQERETGKILQTTKWDRYTSTGIYQPRAGVRDLKVYPNPARDALFIDLGATSGNQSRIEIIDMTGRVVQIEKLAPGTNLEHISIGNLSRGIYFLNWIDDGVLKGRSKVIRTD